MHGVYAVTWKYCAWEEVSGIIIKSMGWEAAGLRFVEHLQEFVIDFRGNSCDRKVGGRSDDKVWKLQALLEALLDYCVISMSCKETLGSDDVPSKRNRRLLGLCHGSNQKGNGLLM